jgi:hypothetical protein
MQGTWGELAKWYPESARDFQNLKHFLALIEGGLKTRNGRLQNALGTQHLILSQQLSGIFMLAKSGTWLAIPPLVSSVFQIAIQGIYLSEHPNRVTDFVEFSWYETHTESEPIEADGLNADIAKGINEDRKNKFEKLHLGYQHKTSWHDHDVDSLAEAVGMAYLLPVYHSTNRLAQGSPIEFMTNGKGGRLRFDRHREITTPAMAVDRSFVMVCHSTYHFYRAVLSAFDVSNEMILHAFEVFKSTLARESDS